MSSLRYQRTLAAPAVVEGFGYWSGQHVRVELHPAPPGSGRHFVRTDQSPTATLSASAAYRDPVPRRTVLQSGDIRVEMVEHLLAALAGLSVDNCEIRINAAELPGCDGSSSHFVAAIYEAGIVEQPAAIEPLEVTETVRVENESGWIEATPPRSDGLSIDYELDYGEETPIGHQHFELEITPRSFRQELSTSRTFLFESEAQWLAAQGLGSRVSPQDLLIFGSAGPIQNDLRFADECVRHKILDVVGDLALAGCPIHGHVSAHRSGHQLNGDLVDELLRRAECGILAAKCA